MSNTTRVELDRIEVEPGVYVCAEVEVGWDQEVVGYDEHEGYAEPRYEDIYLPGASIVDSDIFLLVDGEEVMVSWERDTALFAVAEKRIITWLVTCREGCQMVEASIEDDCVAAAEAWHERSLEARW